MSSSKLLKKDIFGSIELLKCGAAHTIRRNTRPASVWIGWIARRLLAREAKALAVLAGVAGVPEILRVDREMLEREYVAGVPMQDGQPANPEYFRAAARLLRNHHRRNVAHNDLAKEPNFILCDDGSPAIIDYQLAWYAPRRSRLFRVLAREDIRHLLKHKRTYCPDYLTAREKRILATPSVLARFWSMTGKRLYLFITRRMMGWRDREGAGERF